MKQLLNIEKTSWIHLVNPSNHEINNIVDKYDLHEIIEEDLKESNTQDKIDVYDNSLFLVLHFPKYHLDTKKHYSNEFNIIISNNFIFSFSKHTTKTIKSIKYNYMKERKEQNKESKENKENREERELKSSPYYILYKILDELLDKTLLWLKKYNKELLAIEDEIFDKWDNINNDLLWILLRKSRNITFLKNLMQPHEEIVEELNKATIKLHQWDLEVYFEDLQYKIDKIMNTIKRFSDNTESISSKYNTLVTMKTNTVVSLLTTVTVVIGFLTLITGFYGMNVSLPGQNSPSMRVFISIIMLLLAIIMLLIFKKKDWL